MCMRIIFVVLPALSYYVFALQLCVRYSLIKRYLDHHWPNLKQFQNQTYYCPLLTLSVFTYHLSFLHFFNEFDSQHRFSSSHVCSEVTQKLSAGARVSRKHSVTELTHLRLQRHSGHEQPSGLTDQLTVQKRGWPGSLWDRKTLFSHISDVCLYCTLLGHFSNGMLRPSEAASFLVQSFRGLKH